MNPILTFKKVKKIYQDGNDKIEVLKETDFSIYPGELVAIIGPSGSGKSTLLTIMGGLQQATSGQILFEDIDITTLSIEERNQLRFKDIGFILQSSNLVPYLTIEEQFQFVDTITKSKPVLKADTLLEEMGIGHRKKAYPNELSGGERQRCAIARALYPKPKLLLADEPTASLDTTRAIQIVTLLQHYTRQLNQTTVMVTHDTRLLDYCDRVFRITDGVLEEQINDKS